MNKIYVIVLIILIIFSCKKTEEEGSDVFGEIVYTDSFSPKEWENPVARAKIEALDKDIGKIIEKDSIDPRLRNIVSIIENFILYSSRRDFNRVKDILTSSAYNSYVLRYPDVTINKKYSIRIAYPDQIDASQFWLQYKIIFPTYTIISRIEIENNGRNLKISDIDEKFFKNIEELFLKKKS